MKPSFIYLFLAFIFINPRLSAQSSLGGSGNANINKVLLHFPSSLDFNFRKMKHTRANEIMLSPFNLPHRAAEDKRYVSSHYLDVMLVSIVYAVKFEQKLTELNKEIMKKHNLTLLKVRDKNFGDKGKIFHFHQSFIGVKYIKYISIFGNKHQTVVVAGIFTTKMQKTFIPKLVEHIVERASITDIPIN